MSDQTIFQQNRPVFLVIATLFAYSITLTYQQTTEFPLGDIGFPLDYTEPLIKGLPESEDDIKEVKPYPQELSIPSAYDLRDEGYISPVRNQKNLKGCSASYAFAAVGVLEAAIRKNFGESLDLSEQHLISCDPSSAGCEGGGMAVFEFWGTTRPNLEKCDPYSGANGQGCTTKCPGAPYEVKEWYNVDREDVYGIKFNLMQTGPGYFGFDIHPSFFAYWKRFQRGRKGAIYDETAGIGEIGRLACQLIGWNDRKEAWLLQNSWGLSPPGPMGDGTFWLPYKLAGNLHYTVSFIMIIKVPPTVGRAAVKTEDTTCWNQHRCCDIWSNKNQCIMNFKWMSKNCLVSCGNCDPTFLYDLNCRDYYSKCSEWAGNNQCRRNKSWMEMNCRASCNSCDLFDESLLETRCII